MASHGGVRTKIALLGSYGRPNRPIAGMRHIFVYYASLRSKLKKKTISRDAQYPQLHSPARAQQESEKCSREVVPAETTRCRRPNPVSSTKPLARATKRMPVCDAPMCTVSSRAGDVVTSLRARPWQGRPHMSTQPCRRCLPRRPLLGS